MGKLKEDSGKMEKMPKEKGHSGSVVKIDTNEEAPGTINAKHFGHVLKTAKTLHGSDPGWGQHKRG